MASKKIGEKEANAGNWGKGMSIAYGDGLKDGYSKKKSRANRYSFTAAYKEGYRHGVKKKDNEIERDKEIARLKKKGL